ncbi:EmrB/QacA subfamily drug resistance transporter [Nocardioides sp. BE266]|uniref:MFS transporter n=1 Tax=Nocardioides sp. BE266 TaxID=2817725 RepID=UPI002860416E|nr:MFS transporter [Nocardioides sp. BE266]MDR7251931.1 EmrB/QacA subfamily drug resistance transporter [Nocardioides sp. BE266]
MRSKLPVLLTVCAAVLAINLDTTIVNVALPSISTDLDAGTRALQWIVDGYNLAFAALVLAAGSLSDRYGRRPALILGLLGFAAASTVGALVDSAGALVAARVAMGAAAAVIFPTTLSIISNTFRERRERAAALGIWGAVVGIGVAAGPVTGGLLLEHFAWGSVFWALVPLAVVTAGAAYVLVPESRDPSVPRLDLPGLALSVAMLSTLVLTIIEAPEQGWSSPEIIGGFVLSAVLLLGFVAVERRAEHPMLDLSLFRDRRFSAASGAVTVTFFALFGFIFLITQYFQFVRGYGTLSTGARILPVALSIAVASVVGAILAPRIGTKAVVSTGLLLFGSAFLWVSTVSVDASYATVIVPQMVLMGLGMGFISTPATESILLVLPPSRAGVGSAVNDATRELGGTLGVAVVGSVFSSVYAARLGDGTWAQLPGDVLASAQDSVGAAAAIAAGQPGLGDGFQDAFMSGLHTGSLVIGLLCLAGAVVGLFALPGRGTHAPEDTLVDAVPVPA